MRKNRMTRILAILFLIASLLCLAACGGGNSNGDNSGDSTGDAQATVEPAQVQKETAAGIVRSLSKGDVGVGSEWKIIAIARSPIAKEPEATALFDDYRDSIRVMIKRSEGVLDREQPTVNARVAIALKTIGEDPGDIDGYDLLRQFDDEKAVDNQGVNAKIWALIAAACCDRTLEHADIYIEDILKMQKDEGGFTFDGKTEDVDITAMAVQALSIYKSEDERVSEATERAVQWLAGEQHSDGSYGNTESTAQVIIAAGYSGEDISSMEGFIKEGNTLMDGLMMYRFKDGFRHKDEESVNEMATEQALCAIDAWILSENGEALL